MGNKVLSWLKIARLQFYLMTFISYSLGASLAQQFSLRIFLLGFLLLFFIELCTVLTNEYYDYPSDKINENASPFNGGSRVLVEGKLSFSEVKTAVIIVLAGILVLGYILILTAPDSSTTPIIILFVIGLFLGLGYTVPPLKFSHRGVGEVVVGFTHSFYVILCGYIFQTGTWSSALPWFLSIPLFFAVSGAIILANLPDYHANKKAEKKSVAVIWGPQQAAILAIAAVLLAAVSATALFYLNIISSPIVFIVIPHALILGIAIFDFIKRGNYNRTINGIMLLALSYILWFGIIPLIGVLYDS